MTISLHLNNKPIRGHNLKINVTLPLASEDVSGQSSSTAKVEKGDKGKTIKVSLQIQFKNAKDLTDLVALAEGKDKKTAERVIYDILERTANAMKVRKVKFDGDLSVSEDSSLELWNIDFTLAEHSSVPEKKADRAKEKKKAVAVQKSTGKTVSAATKKPSATTAPTASTTPAAKPTAPANPTPSAPKKTEELSTLEKILKSADTAIGNARK